MEGGVLCKPIALNPDYPPRQQSLVKTIVGNSADKNLGKTMSNRVSRQNCNRQTSFAVTPVTMATVIATEPQTPPAIELPLHLVSAVSVKESTDNVASCLTDFPKKRGDINIEYLLKIVRLLSAQPDLQPGVLFNRLDGSLQDRLEQIGCSSTPFVAALLQELGLLRLTGAGKAVTWHIIDVSFLNEEMLNQEWFDQGVRNAQKWNVIIKNLRVATERVVYLEEHLNSLSKSPEVTAITTSPLAIKTVAEIEPAEDQLLVQIAALDASRDEALALLVLKEQEIASLKEQLATKPAVTKQDIVLFLAAKLAGNKS